MPRWFPAVVRALMVAAYPLVVYVGLGRWSPRVLALVLLLVLLPGLALRLRSARREDLWPVLRV
ncbi:MAG TPA: hypothetical protein VIK91_20300, partial [Nannocystis sp.]